MTAKKKIETVSVIDQLADDAAPPDYPEGAPELQPWLQIRPRSRRAEFKRKFAELETVKDQVEALRETGVLDPEADVSGADQMRASATIDDMFQQMDELLVLAAVDPRAYQQWSDELEDDNELTRLFNAYMHRSQPGEVSSSAS